MPNRRTVLRTVGATGLLGLGGCTGGDGGKTTDPPPTEPKSSESGATDTPTTLGPIEAVQTEKLADSDGEEYDYFGSAVAVSADGTTAVVGARNDDDQTGSASIFERSGGSWSWSAKLFPEDEAAPVAFGTDVAIGAGGDRVFVSAPSGGGVSVFDRTTDGWARQAVLHPPGDRLAFGRAIAASRDGQSLLVGNPAGDRLTIRYRPDQSVRGSAFVFEFEDSWEAAGTLQADEYGAASNFAFDVALADDGETAIVGAPLRVVVEGEETSNPDDAVASAAVFERSGGSWGRVRTLTARDGTANETFGGAVATDSDASVALVGAPYDEPAGLTRGGVVYAYTGEGFDAETSIVPAGHDADFMFGYALDLSADGTTALLSARGPAGDNGYNAGAAYAFGRAGRDWRELATLIAGDGDRGDYFGRSVATSADGGSVVAGAETDEDPHGEDCGAAYHFALESA